MRQRLEAIIKLTTDDTYSHAARMVSIRKEAEEALVELEKAVEKVGVTAGGAKAGEQISPKNPPTPVAAPK